MINPTDLSYFLEVANTGHVSRAAERLGITQPALSHCLKRIEDQMDCRLVVRSKKGVTLTPEGIRLRDEARELMMQWGRVMNAVKEDGTTVRGLVKLGCHTAVAQYTFPAFIPSLLSENPELELQLHHGLSRHMTEQVISSQLDVAIAVNPTRHPDLVIKEICRDLVTLWRAKGCVNPDVLLVEPNILQTQELMRRMAKVGRTFRRRVECGSLEVIAQLLTAGAGQALLPERVLRAMNDDRVEKVRDAPILEDRICLVFKPEFARTRKGRALVDAAIAALG